MGPTSAPYFAALKARLDLMGERQRLVAENLANASTPDFKPRDVDVARFEKALAAHVQARMGAGGRKDGVGAVGAVGPGGTRMPDARVRTAIDTEVTIDGNAVVLEDQMLKANETRQAYETALALYQKGLQLIRLAGRRPGG